MSSPRRPPRSLLPSRPVWRDNALWIGYALAAVAVWLVITRVMGPWWSAEPEDPGRLLLMLAAPLLLLFLVVSALRWFWHCTWRYWRVYCISRGHLTRREAQAQEAMEAHKAAVRHARAVAADLRAARSFSLGPAWDVRLDDGERTLFNGGAHYSRFYGQDVVYDHMSAGFYGSPLFVAAGLGATAVGNRSRRNAALRQAAAQWREGQVTRCLVTDQRVLVHHLDSRWLSFWFNGVRGVYPAVDAETLILEFDDTSPLRLQGPASLVASVVAVQAVHGEQGLLHHPALEPLRSPAGLIDEA